MCGVSGTTLVSYVGLVRSIGVGFYLGPYHSYLIRFATGDAVLFSAHFDSAATAPGATDDGMSVAALLQMLTFLAENQPRRTAVFNINNGEENGLSGAHVYVIPSSY